MITIGDKQFAIRTPKALDGALIETSGCSAAEHAQMLGYGSLPAAVATALLPFIFVDGGNAPSVGELAEMIAAADDRTLPAQVRQLIVKAIDGQAEEEDAA